MAKAMLRIFWPKDVDLVDGFLVGRKLTQTTLCVVDRVTEEQASRIRKGKQKAVEEHDEEEVSLIGRLTKQGNRIHVKIINDGTPTIRYSDPLFIKYAPPNPKRLRFLSINPITITPRPPLNPDRAAQIEALSRMEAEDDGKKGIDRDVEVTVDEAVKLINQVYNLRKHGYRSKRRKKPDRLDSGFREDNGTPSQHMSLEELLQISATIRQIHLRYTQLKTAPREWSNIQNDIKTSWSSLRESSVRYIRFCNMMWLIVNDLIVGICLARLLRQYDGVLVDFVQTFQETWLIKAIQTSLRWLDDWPVGLKLNTQLSALLCSTFSHGADIWASVLNDNPSLVPLGLYTLFLGSHLGGSMFLSILHDLVSLATVHLRIATWLIGRVYAWEVEAGYSLWNLFRGKRWNTLRHRVDSYDYDMDQLFLGTLLFTVTIFLLPTIATYYLFFSLVQILLFSFKFLIETSLAFINSFPLFALMLRIKESSRLPGGVNIRTRETKEGLELELVNVPLPFSAVFSGFGSSWAELTGRYGLGR